MAGRLEGKVALITGSTRGIGAAIAKGFAAEGASVVVTGRSNEAGNAVVSAIRSDAGRAVFVATDVTDEDAVQRAVDAAQEEFGSLTTLVNCAAPTDLVGPGGLDRGVADLPSGDCASILAVGLIGMINCCRAAVPAMVRAGRGSILNISSTTSVLGVAGTTAYAAAKGGMNALTRQMAVEYGAQGIRSNGLIVGLVLSGNVADVMATDPVMGPALLSAQVTRFGRPEDVAYAATFLASDEAEFITGVLLPVDGGQTAKLNIGDVSAVLDSQMG